MLRFLSENWGTILVLVLVVGAVIFAVIKMRSDKKQGKSSCGCNCQSCPSAGMCHKATIKK